VDTKEIFDELLPTLTEYGVKTIGVIVVFAVSWILANWSRRALRNVLRKAKLDETLAKFFSNVSRWIILLVAALACLGAFGIETTSFAAVLGAAGLAIGLAFQGSLANLASGVMLLVFRPFSVGDVVNIAGMLGKVDEIDLMGTTLDTFDNRRIIIPNAKIFGDIIENITHHKVRRADIDVGTDYGADLKATRAALEKACGDVPGQPEGRDPAVVLLSLGDNAISWSVRVWTKTEDYGPTRERVIEAVKTRLDEAGIGIPYPQLDVHLKGKDVA